MVKISFVGDIMCELYTYRRMKALGNSDYGSFFESMGAKFAQSDFVVGNLETVAAGQDLRFTEDYNSFNTPDSFLAALAASGIDFVSTANNHCLDRGIVGLERTLDVLDSFEMPHTGTYRNAQESEHVSIVEVCGMKVGLIACTGSTNYGDGKYELSNDELYAIDLLHPQKMRFYATDATGSKGMKRIARAMLSGEQKIRLKKLLGKPVNSPKVDSAYDAAAIDEYMERIGCKIRRAKQAADFVVVLPHIGGQFNAEPGGCAGYIVDKLCELGADAVVASHPHVVQRAEMRGSVPIAYSIGNYSMSPNSVYLLHELKPEYGIMLHLYFDDRALSKAAFSIIKMEEADELQVIPLEDCYAREQTAAERAALEQDAEFICERVLPGRRVFDGVQPEYVIWEG